MKMKALIGLFILLIWGNNIHVAESAQKYLQISNSSQTENEKIVIYEFFWYGSVSYTHLRAHETLR